MDLKISRKICTTRCQTLYVRIFVNSTLCYQHFRTYVTLYPSTGSVISHCFFLIWYYMYVVTCTTTNVVFQNSGSFFPPHIFGIICGTKNIKSEKTVRDDWPCIVYTIRAVCAQKNVYYKKLSSITYQSYMRVFWVLRP